MQTGEKVAFTNLLPHRRGQITVNFVTDNAEKRKRHRLTFSPPTPLTLYTLPYWSNPPFLIFWHSGALALRTERQSARMSKIKNGGLDQYGAEPFEQQQFRTAGIEGVNNSREDTEENVWLSEHKTKETIPMKE